jgi:hypothetical protein
MGGGLMQLVAYGAQDIYLTGNPQITFFKVVYRRHTNFAMEAIQQTINGTVGAGASTVTATISRNGDLVGRLWLDVKMTSQTAASAGSYANWINNTGHALLKECEIEIGGQKIDKHYSRWLDIWNELTDHDEQEWLGLNKHQCNKAYLLGGGRAGATNLLQLYIPLQFWFCRNPGLALPLIALQYHEVKVKLSTRGMAGLVSGDDNTALVASAPAIELWADYIYLDTDERRRFAQVSHEYLIEQVQQEVATSSTSIKLNLNHPVKELIWVFNNTTVGTEQTTITTQQNTLLNVGTTATAGNDYFNYVAGASQTSEKLASSSAQEYFTTANLKLNGHDRFSKRNATYFRTCQPIQAGHKVPKKHIYCYSFALKPEEHQPSGTCNFSRIDNAKLELTAVTGTSNIYIYAINYNVLRIMSGMGGLAYSN